MPAFWEMAGKIHGLLLAVTVYYPYVAYGLIAIVALAAIYARRLGVLSFHPVGWIILGVGAITYFAMPRALFGAHLADQRLPIAIAFMAIACIDINLHLRSARHGLVALLVLLIAVRLTEVQLVWNQLDRGTEEFFQLSKPSNAARVFLSFSKIAHRARRSAISTWFTQHHWLRSKDPHWCRLHSP